MSFRTVSRFSVFACSSGTVNVHLEQSIPFYGTNIPHKWVILLELEM
jgi:hypothetical protein